MISFRNTRLIYANRVHPDRSLGRSIAQLPQHITANRCDRYDAQGDIMFEFAPTEDLYRLRLGALAIFHGAGVRDGYENRSVIRIDDNDATLQRILSCARQKYHQPDLGDIVFQRCVAV